MKQKFFKFGVISSLTLPLLSVLACGNANTYNGIAWERDTKKIYFNFNDENSTGTFTNKYNLLDETQLQKLDYDIEQAMTSNNVLKIAKDGSEKISVIMVSQFDWENGADQDLAGNPHLQKVNVTSQIKINLKQPANFEYRNNPIDLTNEPFNLHSNIIPELLKGLNQLGIITNSNALNANQFFADLILKQEKIALVSPENFKTNVYDKHSTKDENPLVKGDGTADNPFVYATAINLQAIDLSI